MSSAPVPPGHNSAIHLERVAIDVGLLAAHLVRSNVGIARASHTKSSPTDVVTETDVSSEELIRSELLARCPGSTIVGEELPANTGRNNIGWIVDPIDGTVNFLYDLPVVAVSIAATRDGVTVAGAVVDVIRQEVFSAHRGGGARRDNMPLTASGTTDLRQALVGTGFSYAAATRAEQATILNTLLPACRDIRCMGSAALNLCWVGCGRLDAYYERDLKPYDYAAGVLIAVEGGATVTTPNGASNGLTLAATSAIANELESIVSGVNAAT